MSVPAGCSPWDDQSIRGELMKEVWRPVRGYEGLYEVSDLGRVRSLARIVKHPRGDQRKPEKLMKLVPDPVYYRSVSEKTARPSRFGSHVSCICLLPDPPGPVGNRRGCYQVDHINENKFDNKGCEPEGDDGMELVTAMVTHTF